MRPRIKKESGNDMEKFKSRSSKSHSDDRRDSFKRGGRDDRRSENRNFNRYENRNTGVRRREEDEFSDERRKFRKDSFRKSRSEDDDAERRNFSRKGYKSGFREGFKSNRFENEDNRERRDFRRRGSKSGSARNFKTGFKRGGRKEEDFNKKHDKSYGGFAKSDIDFRATVKKTVKKKTKNQPEETADNNEIRLNKFISNSGVCSRREADEYITAGLVTVNGKVVTELGVKVSPEDDIRFNGERLKGERKVYVLMNKPKDFVTTLSDPHAEKNVMQLINRDLCSERIFPVGRLDKSTTGVLLLTNDGELAEKLTHPSFQKKKIYQVTLDKNLKGYDMNKLIEGIELEDGIAFADEVSYVDENRDVIGVEIHSGKNRIVRRMFEALGYRIRKLDRVYFAGLTKKNLRRGQWRFLSEEEVTKLKLNFYE